MDFSDNLKELKRNTKHGNNIRHKNDTSRIIPFVHRGQRPIYKHGFYNIIGHLSRYILEYEWDINLLNQLIPNLLNNIQGNNEDKILFKMLLNEFLFNKHNNIIISHPFLFLFAPPSYIKKEDENNTNYINKTNGERELALFFKHVLFNNFEEIYSFFSDKNSDNYILKFILDNIEINKHDYNEKPFYPILTNVIDMFQEDFRFAMNHHSFLLENIDHILAYYYFFYSTQLIMKIHNDFDFCKDDDHTIEEAFYLLDGEIAQDYRKAVYVGYNSINVWVEELLCKIYVIDQLNILLGKKDYMWGDILNFFENELNSNDQKKFFENVRTWVKYYSDIRNITIQDLPSEPNTTNLKFLINILYKCLMDENGVKKGTRESRYPLNLLELGKNFHLVKFRGIYKYTLNLTNDMLLLLTALSVKDKTNMKINELFLEFERRGIFLDSQSQDEVFNFLNKRNLIDEKSDSEEAKYVKPIL